LNDINIKILINNKSFFENYKKKFIELFSKNLKNYIISENELKELYNIFFINPILFKNTNIKIIYDIEYKLNQYDISLTKILENPFLFITNSFTKHLLINQLPYNQLKQFVLICDFYLNYLKKHRQKEILLPNEIYEIFSNKEKITIYNIFKGIPLSHNTHILSINKNEIILNATLNFIFASKYNSEIYFNQENKNYL